jgi:hypothetical protein
MTKLLKKIIFSLSSIAILMIGGVVIYGAIPQGYIKIVNQENATSTSNNPVGWWKMDEGTGQYAYDSSGNGNTGTLGTSTSADGADPTWATGKLGKGLSFDGTNDYVTVTTTGNLLDMPTNNYTFSTWIKTTHTTGVKYIAAKGNAFNSVGYTFYLANDARPSFSLHDGVDNYYANGPVSIINNGVWHHLVYVIDRGNSANNKIYVDGTSRTTTPTGTWANIGSISNALNFTMGAESDAGNPLVASLDDVRIYNRALTAGEVSQMFNSTQDGYLGKIKVKPSSTAKIKMSTGLVGYWKLDDNNALTSVIDYSGKGNTGTAYSGTATSTSVLSTSTATIGRAFAFDGADDYVDMGNQAIFDIAGNLTISAWIKPTVAKDGTIAAKGQSSSLGYRVYIATSTNKISFLGVNNSTAIATNAVSLNVWSKIDVVRSGTNVLFYINGVLNKNQAVGGTVNAPATAQTFKISRRSDTASTWFNGIIDDVKIWNYARTAEQIKQDYERGLMGREQ